MSHRIPLLVFCLCLVGATAAVAQPALVGTPSMRTSTFLESRTQPVVSYSHAVVSDRTGLVPVVSRVAEVGGECIMSLTSEIVANAEQLAVYGTVEWSAVGDATPAIRGWAVTVDQEAEFVAPPGATYSLVSSLPATGGFRIILRDLLPESGDGIIVDDDGTPAPTFTGVLGGSGHYRYELHGTADGVENGEFARDGLAFGYLVVSEAAVGVEGTTFGALKALFR